MGRMIEACKNLKELDVKNLNTSMPRERIEMIEFYSSIRFNNLMKLTICELHLFDGSYLPMV